MKPSAMARMSRTPPTTQFSSRGLRKAPVKKTRSMCTPMEATNSSAAQWWTWRMNRPPRTSKEMFSDEFVRHRHFHALQRDVAAVVVRLRHGRVEEERQEGAGEQQDDEGVQRDLAEHEGPVVGEDLPAEFTQDSGAADALVDEVGDAARLVVLGYEGDFSC